MTAHPRRHLSPTAMYLKGPLKIFQLILPVILWAILIGLVVPWALTYPNGIVNVLGIIVGLVLIIALAPMIVALVLIYDSRGSLQDIIRDFRGWPQKKKNMNDGLPK